MPTDLARRLGSHRGAARAARLATSTAALVATFVTLVPLLLTGQDVPPGAEPLQTGVTLDVAVDSPNAARVRARYRLPADTLAPHSRLQYLARPCTAVDAVVLTTSHDRIALTSSPNGPWVQLAAPLGVQPGAMPDALAGASSFDIEYRVRWSGPVTDVPLIHLTRPIPRREGEREGEVTVRVALPDTRSTVRFPQLRRDGTGSRWTGRFVAIPSFVRVALPGRTSPACADAATATSNGDDGGLTWRFWLLVGIMVAWVPLYLAWARRLTEHDT